MEPEPSLAALLEAITALTATVGSLQDQIKSQGKQITQLTAICKETNNLEGKPTLQARLGLAQGPLLPSRGTGFDSKEEEEPRRPKKEPQGTPRRSLSSLTPFDAGSSVKRPKMDLPDPYKGDTRGRKATQWLDRMLLWVALHRDQFDKEEQMVVGHYQGQGEPSHYYPGLTAKFKEAFADPNAKQAAARKIATLTQTTTTSEYVTKFRNLMAELDWNTEAYIAQFTRGLHWKVKELLSTKDNIPNNDLEAIFAALVKIDNTCWENKENRLKKTPAKSRPPWPPPLPPLGSAYPRTPIMSHPKKETDAAHLGYASNAVRRDTELSNVPMVGKPQSRRWLK
ncbi:Retrotransposon gag protein [Rhizoctonia solani]|uniref:Retrotransposon gag protein n=1 Tax=Rhizoctonia solani TaxID=456999 RepID=A0A8H7I0E5_9AGAM|nr:Retrotransposon gag protein [Rhizoctonia solani]KAF8748908.1 Retrotransposon gag protein [Rhizoctonia solani]